MRVYVDNFHRETTEVQLQTLFEGFGNVASVVIVRERPGGPSCGFGFIEMQEPSEARTAITALNGSRLGNLVLKVDEA
jgi:RNA recognition motif-containing protein